MLDVTEVKRRNPEMPRSETFFWMKATPA